MLGDGINRYEEDIAREVEDCRLNLNELETKIKGCEDPDGLWVLKQRILRTKDRIKELSFKNKPN